MISREIAEIIVHTVKRDDVDFVELTDDRGVVLSSTNVSRIGMLGHTAQNLLSGETNLIERQDAISNHQNIIKVIFSNAVRIGTLSVTGEENTIHAIVDIVDSMLQVVLQFEAKYEAYQEHSNVREAFNQALLYDKTIKKDVLISKAERLDIDTECMRVAIFIVADPRENLQHIITASRDNPYASPQDIVMETRSSRVAVFKNIKRRKNVLKEYRDEVCDYLEWWKDEFKKRGIEAYYYVGTLQDDLQQYKRAYQHAVWLRTTKKKGTDGICWFYDFTDEYLKSLISKDEYNSIFSTYTENIPKDIREYYNELVGTLIKCNYNLVNASKQMFVHKNTIAFRFEKVKQCLEMNPMQNSADRSFINNLFFYLNEKDIKE